MPMAPTKMSQPAAALVSAGLMRGISSVVIGMSSMASSAVAPAMQRQIERNWREKKII